MTIQKRSQRVNNGEKRIRPKARDYERNRRLRENQGWSDQNEGWEPSGMDGEVVLSAEGFSPVDEVDRGNGDDEIDPRLAVLQLLKEQLATTDEDVSGGSDEAEVADSNALTSSSEGSDVAPEVEEVIDDTDDSAEPQGGSSRGARANAQTAVTTERIDSAPQFNTRARRYENRGRIFETLRDAKIKREAQVVLQQSPFNTQEDSKRMNFTKDGFVFVEERFNPEKFERKRYRELYRLYVEVPLDLIPTAVLLCRQAANKSASEGAAISIKWLAGRKAKNEEVSAEVALNSVGNYPGVPVDRVRIAIMAPSEKDLDEFSTLLLTKSYRDKIEKPSRDWKKSIWGDRPHFIGEERYEIDEGDVIQSISYRSRRGAKNEGSIIGGRTNTFIYKEGGLKDNAAPQAVVESGAEHDVVGTSVPSRSPRNQTVLDGVAISGDGDAGGREAVSHVENYEHQDVDKFKKSMHTSKYMANPMSSIARDELRQAKQERQQKKEHYGAPVGSGDIENLTPEQQESARQALGLVIDEIVYKDEAGQELTQAETELLLLYNKKDEQLSPADVSRIYIATRGIQGELTNPNSEFAQRRGFYELDAFGKVKTDASGIPILSEAGKKYEAELFEQQKNAFSTMFGATEPKLSLKQRFWYSKVGHALKWIGTEGGNELMKEEEAAFRRTHLEDQMAHFKVEKDLQKAEVSYETGAYFSEHKQKMIDYARDKKKSAVNGGSSGIGAQWDIVIRRLEATTNMNALRTEVSTLRDLIEKKDPSFSFIDIKEYDGISNMEKGLTENAASLLIETAYTSDELDNKMRQYAAREAFPGGVEQIDQELARLDAEYKKAKSQAKKEKIDKKRRFALQARNLLTAERPGDAFMEDVKDNGATFERVMANFGGAEQDWLSLFESNLGLASTGSIEDRKKAVDAKLAGESPFSFFGFILKLLMQGKNKEW